MQPQDVEQQVAYGRLVAQLGLVPEATVRSLGSACLHAGRDLRQALLERGLLRPEDDARVLALLGRGPTAAAPERATLDAPADPQAPTRPAALRALTRPRLPAAGETFAGLRIVRELARGGMGAVFVAERPDGGRVALKLVLGDLTQGDRAARFAREAEAGRLLDHPGAVKLLGHGEEGGVPFLVMELLEGARPLDQYCRAEQSPLDARLGMLVRAAEAIQAAHDQGLIHRDLKPDNVLVTPAGEVKVVDFGLARHVDRERLTQSGAVMGTIQYMAPEQCRGATAHADPRTDVFALGVMLHELVSGELPFPGETALEVMRAILQDPPLPLRARPGEELPPARREGLEAVIAMALAKAPEERYPTARAFAIDLAAVLAGSRQTAAGKRERDARARSRRRVGLLAAVAALVVSVAALAWSARGPGRLGEAALEAATERLEAETDRLLRAERFLAADRAQVDALARELAQVRARAPAEAAALEGLERVGRRIEALVGLATLAQGDAPGARAALDRLAAGGALDADPVVGALAGAVSAVATEAPLEPRAALRALERARARGLARPDLLAWQLHARARAGFAGAQDAAEALADVEALARLRGGAAAPEERAVAVRARLAQGDLDGARAELASLEGALSPASALALRWELALVAVERALEASDAPWAAALAEVADLPPWDGLEPARAAAAARALALLGPLLARAGERRLAPEDPGRFLEFCRLHAALRPGLPVPRAAIDPLLANVSAGWRDLELSVALMEGAPDALDVQRAVALQVKLFPAAGQQRRLLPALRRAIALEPDPPRRLDLQVELCVLLADLNDPEAQEPAGPEKDEVIELASYLLPRLPEPHRQAEVLGARARMLRHKGRVADALLDIEAAAELGPGVLHLPLWRGRILHDAGRHGEALDALVPYALEQPESSLRAVSVAIQAAQRLGGRYEEAIRAIDDLVAKRPSYADFHTRAAELELRAGRREAAIARLERAAAVWRAPGRRKPEESAASADAADAAAAALRAAPDQAAARAALAALRERLAEVGR